MGLCECGCGMPTKIMKQSDTKRGYVRGQHHRFVPGHNARRERGAGYRQRFAPTHPNAKGDGLVYEHVLIAERALGSFLPRGAEVHHVDGNSLNNSTGNLVICQDKAYHKLLHYRARLVALGGDPNREKCCCDCAIIKPLSEFNIRKASKSSGRQSMCRECGKVRDAHKRARLTAKRGVYVPPPDKVEA